MASAAGVFQSRMMIESRNKKDNGTFYLNCVYMGGRESFLVSAEVEKMLPPDGQEVIIEGHLVPLKERGFYMKAVKFVPAAEMDSQRAGAAVGRRAG